MKEHREWEVRVINDCEGRTTKSLGFFTNEAAAKKAAKGADMYGRDGHVRENRYMIYDTLEEFKNGKKEELRLEALKKLTKEEIEALGLE